MLRWYAFNVETYELIGPMKTEEEAQQCVENVHNKAGYFSFCLIAIDSMNGEVVLTTDFQTSLMGSIVN